MLKLVIVVALAGCARPSNQLVAYTPVSGATAKSKTTAIQQAVVAITDAGQEIASSDGATGIALSKWFVPQGPGGSDMRYRVRVTVSDENAYLIEALCQKQRMTWGEWTGCEGDEAQRPRFVVDLLAQIDAKLR